MSTMIVIMLLGCVVILASSGISKVNADEMAQHLDLESINFAFDSDDAIEDLKQLQRIVSFMNQDAALRLEISAHTDTNGPEAYNQTLSQKRAEAVKQVLVDKGLSPDKILIKTNAFHVPFASNKNLEGQLLNRRADFSIFKLNGGEKEFYYKDNQFIKPLESVIATTDTNTLDQKSAVGPQSLKSLDDVMDRLDHLENLLKENEHGTTLPSEGTGGRTSFGILADNVFSLSGGIGSSDGDLLGNVEGTLFVPVKEGSFALQGGFNADITEDLKEYQVDAGLVGRVGWFQAGAFASMKFVTMDFYQDTATLSQVHVGGSRLFERGNVGVFFTQGIQDEDVVDSQSHYEYADLYTTETYLEVSDKIGVNAEYLFENGLSVYGDIGSQNADEADLFGSLRLSFPVNRAGDLRVFCQGDYNNGYLEADDNYKAFLGIELTTPYRVAKTQAGATAPQIRPMAVQKIGYEVKTRTSVLLSQVNNAPTVSITTSPIQGTSPFQVTFTAVASDSDGTINSYEWAFGDGETSSGEQVVSHTFAGSGIYNVTLTVTDNKGTASSASTMVDVTNAPPEVSISTTTLQGGFPHAVTFTASATDKDGSIIGYEWSFGDGETATGEVVTHTFTQPGSFQVVLKVTDNLFAVTTSSLTVTATSYPPTANLYYTVSVTDPATILFSGSGLDSDGTITSYSWNLGDGTYTGGAQVTHTFAAPGTYTVTLTVADSQGMTTQQTATVNIP